MGNGLENWMNLGRLAKGLGLVLAACTAGSAAASSALLADMIDKNLSAIPLPDALLRSADAPLPSELSKRPRMKLGSKGASVQALRTWIGVEQGTVPSSFDGTLDEAVKRIQQEAGLTPDGIVDEQFYHALTLSEAARKERLKTLSERVSGMDLSGRVVLINIPSFQLKAMQDGVVELESKVVVGRPSRQTPLGEMKIVSLKYNPDWSPPPTIMAKNVLPSLDGDGKWVRSHGLVPVSRENGAVLDWGEVDAQSVREGSVRLYQPAGSGNALGLLKFETTSRENIYLHDTNERHLFSRAKRAHSSGCVRVEKWKELAAWVGAKDEAEIDRKVATKKTFWEKVDPVRVLVIYETADIVNGKASFFPDVYGKVPAAKKTRVD